MSCLGIANIGLVLACITFEKSQIFSLALRPDTRLNPRPYPLRKIASELIATVKTWVSVPIGETTHLYAFKISGRTSTEPNKQSETSSIYVVLNRSQPLLAFRIQHSSILVAAQRHAGDVAARKIAGA